MSAFFLLLRSNPIGARAIPFLVVVLFTTAQGLIPGAGPYWIYTLKLIAGGWLLWVARNALPELHWNLTWESVAVGLGVFVMWAGLDPLFVQLGMPHAYPKLHMGSPWNPPATFGEGTLAAGFFIGVRILGSTLVVPMLEEVFFRSFVYRYLARPDFLTMPLSQFVVRPFLITAVIFGFDHSEWLAGILCGLAYQGLVCWKGRLGDAVTAHAITNCLLGIWVVWKGAWQYW